jgi:hypothetical protein
MGRGERRLRWTCPTLSRYAPRDVSLRCRRYCEPRPLLVQSQPDFRHPKVGSVKRSCVRVSRAVAFAFSTTLTHRHHTPSLIRRNSLADPSQNTFSLIPTPANKLVITTTIPFSKRYAKYLSKKFLKASFRSILGEVWEVGCVLTWSFFPLFLLVGLLLCGRMFRSNRRTSSR